MTHLHEIIHAKWVHSCHCKFAQIIWSLYWHSENTGSCLASLPNQTGPCRKVHIGIIFFVVISCFVHQPVTWWLCGFFYCLPKLQLPFGRSCYAYLLTTTTTCSNATKDGTSKGQNGGNGREDGHSKYGPINEPDGITVIHWKEIFWMIIFPLIVSATDKNTHFWCPIFNMPPLTRKLACIGNGLDTKCTPPLNICCTWITKKSINTVYL